MGQANRSENNNIGLLFSRLTILATPCAISSAVSKDSVNRRAISGLTVNLSTTTSIVFFFFESIVGKSSISYIFWLILTLMKPLAFIVFINSTCSPFLSLTMGDNRTNFDPSFICNT